jgi:hypothetical protein
LAPRTTGNPDSTTLRFARCDPEWLALGLSGRALRVLLALSLHADWSKGFGRCLPHRETIASLTKLHASHVSEAVRELAHEHRLITIVRLGRKNVYYIREIGSAARMPPSDPESFFAHLEELGVRFRRRLLPLAFDPIVGRRRRGALSAIVLNILDDYMAGTTAATLERWVFRRGRL